MRRVIITRGPEQRREAAKVIRDVDIGIPLLQQHADRIVATSPNSLDKRRATAAQRIHIRAVCQQRSHGINLSTRRRQTERTITLRMRSVDIGAMAKQNLQGRDMAPIRGHHDGRAMAPFPPSVVTAAFRRDAVHVGAVRDQIYHDIDVPAGSGVQQRRGGGSAGCETVAQFMAQVIQHERAAGRGDGGGEVNEFGIHSGIASSSTRHDGGGGVDMGILGEQFAHGREITI